MERMEVAGPTRNGRRGTRDLKPGHFDPNSDLLRYVSDLQMTSLVGIVDPPRTESEGAVQALKRPTSGSAW